MVFFPVDPFKHKKQYHQHHEIGLYLGLYSHSPAEGEDAVEILKRPANSFGTEEHPGNSSKRKGDKNLSGLLQAWEQTPLTGNVQVVPVFPEKEKRQEINSVDSSPGHEGPVGAVPESAQQEYDKGVADHQRDRY